MKTRPEILLHPNIPKPLHGMNPRTILGQSWWDEQRKLAYEKFEYKCAACGIHKSEAKYHQWLEAHECYEIDYVAGTARMIEIVPLCHSCHCFIHSGKLLMDLRAGRITIDKYNDIINHGKDILKKVKFPKNPFILREDGMAGWNKWRLILEGKEYYSQFASFDDWKRHYSKI